VTLLGHQELHDALFASDLSSRLVVMPLLESERQIGPASIDVRLGTQFQYFERIGDAGVDPGDDLEGTVEKSQRSTTMELGDPFWLHPGQFVLGATLEYLRLPPHLSAYVVGRSSWGRLGLLVATAIMLQPGWGGNLTLELVNHGESPIALYPGSRIAQLAVHSLSSATPNPYDGKYMGPTGPWASRLGEEQKRIDRLKEVADRLHGRNSPRP
jgi:dCTP deaminase